MGGPISFVSSVRSTSTSNNKRSVFHYAATCSKSLFFFGPHSESVDVVTTVSAQSNTEIIAHFRGRGKHEGKCDGNQMQRLL